MVVGGADGCFDIVGRLVGDTDGKLVGFAEGMLLGLIDTVGPLVGPEVGPSVSHFSQQSSLYLYS